MNRTTTLIFTDLDGTLLDHEDYSWEAAKPALATAAQRGIPVIPCSSKTLAECLTLQEAMGLDGPVIFENGSGIALPKSQFKKPLRNAMGELQDYWLVGFTVAYEQIRRTLLAIRKSEHLMFRGFGDMTVEDVAQHTGLPPEAAALAKERRHSEPLLWLDDAKSFDEFNKSIQNQGLNLTRGGRFVHVVGNSNKGKAMVWLATLYEYQTGIAPHLIALGDSDNDIPMLQEADIAVVVRNSHKQKLNYTSHDGNQRALHTKACGPLGWNQAILKLLEAETMHG